ncbi:alpha/beta hydrolase [Nocardiopsis mangrovi]|uniref:Alpha/beta hydrolase n=1 Tax=Nocardiopsis mangrovi TaxID=1179818 RepID=A0ABV9DTE5_9ACTN
MKRSDRRSVTRLTAGLDIGDHLIAGRNGTIPVRRYRRASAEPVATLVWVHGGAFAFGGLDQLESHAVGAALGQRGIEVVAVDHRRVPPWNWFRDPPAGRLAGTRYPVPLHDVLDVFEVIRHEQAHAVLGGASAGACLSAAAALALAQQGTAAPPLVLAYGTFHAALPEIAPEMRARVRGLRGLTQFRPQTVHRMNRNYAGSEQAMREATAFPGGHDLRAITDVLMIDADRDTLRASGAAFRRELHSAGTRLDYHVIAEAAHGFLDRPSTTPFRRGIDAIATWLSAERRTDGTEGRTTPR